MADMKKEQNKFADADISPAEKFTGKAQIYEKFRPSYPPAVYEFLESLLPSENAVIADIGAGTGLFVMPLISKNFKVYCVEPNADMRAVLNGKAGGFANCTCAAASAEHTGLPDGCVNLVTAAQAFHWFDRLAFKAECRRILKPRGKTALIWNSRSTESGLAEELAGINKKYCPSFNGFSGGTHGSDSYADFFTEYKTEVFENDIFDWNAQSFIGRCLSSSYAPKEGDKNYLAYTEALNKLFEERAEGGRLAVKYRTLVFWGGV